MIAEIANLPDVSFIEDKTLDDVQQEMLEDYAEKYEELTGKELVLKREDPEALKLFAASIQIYQMYLHIDNAGKMDLLKYAYGEFLDNLGGNRGEARLPATKATATVRFTLSDTLGFAVTIPAGTRVSNGDDIYFETDAQVVIAAGDIYADIACTCQTAGEVGSGLIAGVLNTLVDPIAYVESVSNTEETSGGTDIEDDEDFKDRIYLAPSNYSSAGPGDAYEYYTLSCSPLIGDVEVTSPNPCEVKVCVLLEGGTIPDASFLSFVANALDDRTIRPLSDRVTVTAPTAQTFNVEMTYYIDSEDSESAASIQEAVAEAVDEYLAWQTGAIARDVNPSKLTQMVLDAGVKRVAITSPTYAQVASGKVAQLGTKTVTYGGIE